MKISGKAKVSINGKLVGEFDEISISTTPAKDVVELVKAENAKDSIEFTTTVKPSKENSEFFEKFFKVGLEPIPTLEELARRRVIKRSDYP